MTRHARPKRVVIVALAARERGRLILRTRTTVEDNFADKWNDYEIRRLNFERWRAAVEQDLAGFIEETNETVALHQRISKAFGSAPVEQAVKVLGAQTNLAREAGNVNFATGGLVTTAATATAVQSHRFFGGQADR